MKEGEDKGKAEGKEEEAVRFGVFVNRLPEDNRMKELQQIARNPEHREQFIREYGI